MITPLRRRHRWLAPCAFGLALVGLGAGLAARPTEFVRTSQGFARDLGVQVSGGAIVFDDEGRFAVAFQPTPTEADPLAGRLTLWPREPLDAPDLLVYRADSRGEGEDLPAGAILVGPASPTQKTHFDIGPGPGFIVLYSLAHGARYDAVDLRAYLRAEAR